MARAPTAESQCRALLDKHREAILKPGKISISCPAGCAAKSFQVYFGRWYKAQGLREEGWTITCRPVSRFGLDAIMLKVKAPGYDPSKHSFENVEHIEPEGPPARTKPPMATESELIEMWAQFCLDSDIPLEDIIVLNDGSLPKFPPTSDRGQLLIRHAKGGAR